LSLPKVKVGDVIRKDWKDGSYIIGKIKCIEHNSIYWEKIYMNINCKYFMSIEYAGNIKLITNKDELFVELL